MPKWAAQRGAPRLPARQRVQLPAQRLQFGGEPVHLAQPGFRRLPPGQGQERLLRRGPPVRSGHRDRGHTLVEQGGRGPLVPPTPLVHQTLIQPGLRPLTAASSDANAAQTDELLYGLDHGPCLTALRTGKLIHIAARNQAGTGPR